MASSTFAAVVLVVVVVFFLSTTRNEGCEQYVIDSYESISGIDIPQVLESHCFYNEEANIRTGVYVIDNSTIKIDSYISNHELIPVEPQDEKVLWNYDMLVNNAANVPEPNKTLYALNGQSDDSQWQCFVDRTTGTMWFEMIIRE